MRDLCAVELACSLLLSPYFVLKVFHLFIYFYLFIFNARAWQTSPVKGQIVNILGFGSRAVSVAIT